MDRRCPVEASVEDEPICCRQNVHYPPNCGAIMSKQRSWRMHPAMTTILTYGEKCLTSHSGSFQYCCRLEAASVQERHLRQEMVNIQEKATANRVQTAQDLQELLASYVHSMAGTFPILEPGCAAGHDGDAQSPSSASSLGEWQELRSKGNMNCCRNLRSAISGSCEGLAI